MLYHFASCERCPCFASQFRASKVPLSSQNSINSYLKHVNKVPCLVLKNNPSRVFVYSGFRWYPSDLPRIMMHLLQGGATQHSGQVHCMYHQQYVQHSYSDWWHLESFTFSKYNPWGITQQYFVFKPVLTPPPDWQFSNNTTFPCQPWPLSFN